MRARRYFDNGVGVVASAKNAAPTAAMVQADTGPLTAGTYNLEIILCAADTGAVGKAMVIEHRDAANAATLQRLGAVTPPDSIRVHIDDYSVAANERIRVVVDAVAGAASSIYVSTIVATPA